MAWWRSALVGREELSLAAAVRAMRVLELVLVWVLVLGQQQQPAGAAFVPQAKP